MLLRSVLVVAVVCGSLVCTPMVARADDYTHSASLSPQNPPVGTNYTFNVTFTNQSGSTILFEAFVDSVPSQDRLLSPSRQERYVGPGQSYTFRFDISCGEPGGTVRWSHRARFAN
jgi:hypothetical protein